MFLPDLLLTCRDPKTCVILWTGEVSVKRAILQGCKIRKSLKLLVPETKFFPKVFFCPHFKQTELWLINCCPTAVLFKSPNFLGNRDYATYSVVHKTLTRHYKKHRDIKASLSQTVASPQHTQRTACLLQEGCAASIGSCFDFFYAQIDPILQQR